MPDADRASNKTERHHLRATIAKLAIARETRGFLVLRSLPHSGTKCALFEVRQCRNEVGDPLTDAIRSVSVTFVKDHPQKEMNNPGMEAVQDLPAALNAAFVSFCSPSRLN